MTMRRDSYTEESLHSDAGHRAFDISFGNVSLVLALYDADGVKAEETYASTSSWAAGEKVRFEAIGSVDAAQVKASVSNYEVAD